MPTVNGRLLFSIIGNSTHPDRARRSNSQVFDEQFVVTWQQRNLSDYLFPQITEKVFSATGKFEFLFVGRAKLFKNVFDASLVGRVYVIQSQGYRRRQVETAWETYGKETQGLPQDNNKLALRRQDYLTLHKSLEECSLLVANVVLRRNGFISVSKLRWKDNSIEQNTIKLATEEDANIELELSNQIYYFIRDIAHQHQHHAADADTIISLTPVSNDDLSWCREIVFSLHSHVINTKRKKSSEEQIRILGVLAYLKSFKKIVEGRIAYLNSTKKTKRTGTKLDQLNIGDLLPFFDEESAKESITASKSYMEAIASRKRTAYENQRTIFLWIVAVVGTLLSVMLGIADKNILPDPNVLAVANWLKHYTWVIFLPFFFVLSWWLARVSFARFEGLRRDIFRLSLYNRKVAIFIGLLFAGTFFYLSYLIFGLQFQK